MKLIKTRCRLAEKQKELDQKESFIHPSSLVSMVKTTSQGSQFIYSLFPPRKQWVSLGMKDRYLMDSSARNEQRLKYTYLKAKAQGCTEQWYVQLCDYADRIVHYALSKHRNVEVPTVVALLKEIDSKEKKVKYRPICQFPVFDKIVFSLLNNYLTILFDDYFLDCSFAFRKVNGIRSKLQHLDAVRKVRDYRLGHIGQSLFVAECDMKKFYDTISHQVIKNRFLKLLVQAKNDGKICSADMKLVKRCFFAYVDCFDFLNHVWTKNRLPRTHSFWRDLNKAPLDYIPIIPFLEKEKDYLFDWRQARTKKGRVGVPQGGALSGLIANIVMHDVDLIVTQTIGNNDLLYCRFCDDMVLMGVNQAEVFSCYRLYEQAIRKARLVAHENKPIARRPMREFWEGKSRGPYEWNEKGELIFPWITFVGFDVNWKGNLRIRKKSLHKQIEKQTEIVRSFLLPFNANLQPRYSRRTMFESLASSLIATGVGRVTFDNYRHNSNNHSWMSAFSILDKNPWSENQMKGLDRHRETMLARAKRMLQKICCPERVKNVSAKKSHREMFVYKGCPFSYYGQCFHYR